MGKYNYLKIQLFFLFFLSQSEKKTIKAVKNKLFRLTGTAKANTLAKETEGS